jgi:hypothetical protein
MSTEQGKYRWIAAMQLAVAILLMIGIWGALPARYLLIDAVGTVVAVLYAAGAVGLVSRVRYAVLVARIASWCALLLGTAAVTALSLSAAHLSGLYGPVGSGGALLLGTVALLVLPYLVALPAVQLALLRRG